MSEPITPLADHPHSDPGDGRSECYVCGKWIWPVTHSCKGVPVTPEAEARLRTALDHPTVQKIIAELDRLSQKGSS